MKRVLGNTLCDLNPKVKVKLSRYLHVNASHPKPLKVAASNFAAA